MSSDSRTYCEHEEEKYDPNDLVAKSLIGTDKCFFCGETAAFIVKNSHNGSTVVHCGSELCRHNAIVMCCS